jgi:CheY-like chemotaxis protein
MNKGYILVVDDEPMIVDTLRMELHGTMDRDIQVLAANSGEEALTIIREEMAQGSYPAVAVVDYLMYPMRGSELLEHIEALTPATRKIMLTGQADLEAVKKVMSSVRLYRYMEKPWRSMDMELTIREALRMYHDEQELRHEADLARAEFGVRTSEPMRQVAMPKPGGFSHGLSYARLIQQCFIPELNEEVMARVNLHIMDRPLAQVSGDFRWFRQIGDELYLAIGDCTGHGLAGAIIAVLATDILSNTLGKRGAHKEEPAAIVRTVLKQLKARLVREGGRADHVGLELTLVRLNLAEGRMDWSSANGFLITVDSEGNTNILSKSRGISSNSASHDDVHAGSMDIRGHHVAMFTDGITDQFGGPLNKRMRLDGLLRQVEAGKVFDPSGRCHIEPVFDAWRGEHEQVDDCLWMSFRV